MKDITYLGPTANGGCTKGTAHDEEMYRHGYTSPNLYRVVDPQQPEDPRETSPRDYKIGVLDGINSYRCTIVNYHDEESTTCEIP